MTDKKRKDIDDALSRLKFRGVSGRELHALLLDIKRSPQVLDAVTDGNLNLWGNDCHKMFKDQMTTVTLPLLDGTFEWTFFSFSKLVSFHAKKNQAFAAALKKALSQSRGRPLNIILYADELTPGNVIRPDNRRKLVQWYASFADFKLHLRNEAVWLPVAVLRSSMVGQIDGGVSTATRALLQTIIREECSILTGTVVEIPEPTLVMGSISVFLGDESALKQLWAVMGSSGIKPCFCCTNVLKKNHRLLSVCPELVDITETDFSKCTPATAEDLWSAQDELTRGVGDRKALQTACGQNYCPNGVLADKDMRPYVDPMGTQFDTMHTYFSGGIAELEVGLFLKALQKLGGLQSTVLQDLCNAWKSHKTHFITLKDFELKGMASAVLIVVPMLRYFLEQFCSNNAAISNEVASFRALHDVVSSLKSIKESAVVAAEATDKLAVLQKRHFESFRRAYGDDYVRPKHHYSLHVPKQIARHQFLYDCFVLERKHQLAKAEIANMRQIAANPTFERNLIAQLNYVQLAESTRTAQRPFLVKPQQTTHGFTVSKMACLTFMDVKATDIIYSDGRAFLVHGCSSTGGEIRLLVEMFGLVEQVYVGCQKWRTLNSFWQLHVEDFQSFWYRCTYHFAPYQDVDNLCAGRCANSFVLVLGWTRLVDAGLNCQEKHCEPFACLFSLMWKAVTTAMYRSRFIDILHI